MTGAIAPLTDFSIWARGNLLVIVLLVLAAILLTRFADWARGRIVHRIDARFAGDEELVRSEAAKHRHVVAQVLTWAILAVVYVVTAVLVVQLLGVPVAGLVAPAALISAALGFGLQRFVQDIGAGFFIMMLDEPTVMGVERMEVDTFSVRMVARTLPGMQFDVGREIRARVAWAFRTQGIIVSAELDTGHATGSTS